MKNYLAVDYGTKRIGTAFKIGDSPIIPSDVLDNDGHVGVISQIQTIINDKDIDELIVGLPYNLKGEIGEQGQITQNFIDELVKKIKIPVHTVDERFTTEIFPDKFSQIDSYSAGAILKSYLVRKKI